MAVLSERDVCQYSGPRHRMSCRWLNELGLRLLLLLLVAGSVGSNSSQAQATVSSEYLVKAAFLYNFIQFVEWPASAFVDVNAPLKICVLGDDPFGSVLEETVSGETIGDRALVVHHPERPVDSISCQLVFISKSEQGRMAEILATLDPSAVLTVSEVEGFAISGGNINFYLEGNKVRFEINPDTARSRGIKLSSQLLRLGKIVSQEAVEWNE